MRITTPSPAIKLLHAEGRFGRRVLDYGAGAKGRNANYLRSLGYEVYAYDPYNGTDCCGFYGVSIHKPDISFSTVFTSFVLNVVPVAVEDEIIADCASYSQNVIHVTRNKDILDMIKGGLSRPSSPVYQFYRDTFHGGSIENFARFGTVTSRGFQRLPELETKGFELIHEKHGWKVYVSRSLS